MKFICILSIVQIFFTGLSVQGYKILGVFPCITHSHYTLGLRLMKELADRGHEIVFISSYPQKKPIKNIRDVSVEEIKAPIREFLSLLFNFNKLSYYHQLEYIVEMGKIMGELTLKSKNVQDLMNSDETFDLVILEHFFNEAMVIFAHRFNCPQISLAPGPTTVFNNYLFGNIAPSSFVTNLMTNFDAKMSFWERLRNTYIELLAQLMIHYRLLPTQNQVLKDAFPDAPDLNTILYNFSLMLVITDTAFDDPVPLQQSIKPIGAYYLSPPKSLPIDLQEFMDNSTEGVVVFTMGSNLNSSDLETEKKKAILNVFSRIKQKVLWKFEEDLPDKSDNVKILSWLPQADVLAHPNTVAFISHGGLLGTSEALYHGVPILGVPVYWDQERNIEAAVRRGFAEKINLDLLDENNFGNGLNKILNNPQYKKEAKRRSALMKDRPITSMDEAMFWIEFVARHKGSPHLRSAALDLTWYQLYLLDIILLGVIIITIIFTTLYFILRRLCRRNNIDELKKNK